VDADARISISNVSGSIVVSGWDRQEVHITGTLGRNVEDLRVEGSRGNLEIEVEYPRLSGLRNAGADLEIKVPHGCHLEASTVNADMDVSDLTGRVSLTTVNGNIGIQGRPNRLSVRSVSGDFVLAVDSPRVEISTVSGDLVISGACARLTLESVSGDIDVSAGPLEELKANTVSGDIEFRGHVAEDADLEFASQSGNVLFQVPEGLGAGFSIETFSGDIDSELGQRPERKSRYAPGKKLEFSVGSGRGSIDIATFSGDVEILAP
jgi:DUF4097 and DUF4098 domain-containing protein YvlB